MELIVVAVPILAYIVLPLLFHYFYKLAGLSNYANFKKGHKTFLFASWGYYNFIALSFGLYHFLPPDSVLDKPSFFQWLVTIPVLVLFYPMVIAQIIFIKSIPVDKIGTALKKLACILSAFACACLFTFFLFIVVWQGITAAHL